MLSYITVKHADTKARPRSSQFEIGTQSGRAAERGQQACMYSPSGNYSSEPDGEFRISRRLGGGRGGVDG
jgi:hypothetical protein